MAEYIERETLLKELEMAIKCKDCPRNVDIITYYDRCACSEIGDICNAITESPAADVQPVKRGHWIEKSEEYYRLWQDSGRSWDDMPYFVTGLKFACSCCFNQYDVNAEGVEEWDFCPKCGADLREGL